MCLYRLGARWLFAQRLLWLQMHVYEYQYEVIHTAAVCLCCTLAQSTITITYLLNVWFFNTAAKIWSSVPLNQTVHVQFSVHCLLIKGLSGTLLHLCLLHFFISFLSVTTFGSMYRGTVSWTDSSDANPNQFVRSCLTDSLLAVRLKSGVGSGDWQGSWSHYAEIWDHIPALDGRSRPEAS